MIKKGLSATSIAITLLVSQPAEARHHLSHGAPVPVVSVAESGGPGRFEFVADGRTFTSRDHAERYLLYRVALFARKRGIENFALLYLPGEAAGTHPPRSDTPSDSFSHWQPHWNYRLRGETWQPWHPEWGDRFWAEKIDLKSVERFQVHAMVELDIKMPSAESEAVFKTRDVIAELRPRYRGSRS